MMSFRRPALAVALLAAATLLPGCPAWTRFCKTIGLCSRAVPDLPEVAPPDFQFVLHGDNLKDPPRNYLLRIERNGQAEYEITVREPQRLEKRGRFEVTEDGISRLWDAIRAAGYNELPARFPGEGEGPDLNRGIQRYSVRWLDYPKEVQTHYLYEERVEQIRAAALSLVPEYVFAGLPSNPGSTGIVIGDTETKRFYDPGSPLLKEVPEDRRRQFSSWHEAVNFDYYPAPDWSSPRGPGK